MVALRSHAAALLAGPACCLHELLCIHNMFHVETSARRGCTLIDCCIYDATTRLDSNRKPAQGRTAMLQLQETISGISGVSERCLRDRTVRWMYTKFDVCVQRSAGLYNTSNQQIITLYCSLLRFTFVRGPCQRCHCTREWQSSSCTAARSATGASPSSLASTSQQSRGGLVGMMLRGQWLLGDPRAGLGRCHQQLAKGP